MEVGVKRWNYFTVIYFKTKIKWTDLSKILYIYYLLEATTKLSSISNYYKGKSKIFAMSISYIVLLLYTKYIKV